MQPSSPFVDRENGTIDVGRVLVEAEPVARLVALFAGLAFVPMLLAFAAGPSPLAALFTVLGQFVLAVGAGVVLIHVVVRGTRLAAE